MTRRDLLSECAQPGTPIDVLTNEWCARCVNPECVRSVVGTKKFDRRVLNWEETLFKNPPKLAPDDPRFAGIMAKAFITIDPGRVPEIRSDWVDPRDLKEPEPAVSGTPSRLVVPNVTPPRQDEGGSGGPSPAAPAEVAPPKPVAPAPTPQRPTPSQRSGGTRTLIGVNAPDQTGKTLRGAPEAPTNTSDPWAVPEPPKPADQVVTPGATIKMGRSGV